MFHDTLIVTDVNWIAFTEITEPIRATAKHRYRALEAACTVYPPDYKTEAEGQIKVVFDEPQRAMTPGQALVIYDGDIVIGGGTIMAVY